MSAALKPLLERIFLAGVSAAEPGRLVREAVRRDARGVVVSAGGASGSARWDSIGRIFLVGGGKAGRAMAKAAAGALRERVAAGAVAVPRGAGGTLGPVRLIESGHPLPDEGSRRAASEILALLSQAGGGDLVIAVLSGGASAMISRPPAEVSPADKEAACRALLRSGADVSRINTVRRHLSRVKGGLLARAAFPARAFVLLLSDVPGDDPADIGSGPFSPDPTTFRDALDVLSGFGLKKAVPAAVTAYLEAGAAGRAPETAKPGEHVFDGVFAAVIGSNRIALDAAAAAARAEGIRAVRVLPRFLRGEARDCAREFAGALRRAAADAAGEAVALVAGGETTVSVRGGGAGGRNQEFALAAAIELDGLPGAAVLACGTDGVDGPTDAAGACADGSTCARAAALGLSPRAFLEANDSYAFFRALSDLVVTGPTGTNVMDVAIGVVAPDSASAT